MAGPIAVPSPSLLSRMREIVDAVWAEYAAEASTNPVEFRRALIRAVRIAAPACHRGRPGSPDVDQALAMLAAGKGRKEVAAMVIDGFGGLPPRLQHGLYCDLWRRVDDRLRKRKKARRHSAGKQPSDTPVGAPPAQAP